MDQPEVLLMDMASWLPPEAHFCSAVELRACVAGLSPEAAAAVMDQPEVLLMDMASWLPQELMDTDEDSDDEDEGAAAADGEEQMTLLQLAHVSGCLLCDMRAWLCRADSKKYNANLQLH
jgi:hypothetical protein